MHVLLQAKPSMTKSSVVDNETGKSMDSTVRTSTGTFFARGQDEVLAAVEKRIAQVRHLSCCCIRHEQLSAPMASRVSCRSVQHLGHESVSHLHVRSSQLFVGSS